MTPLVIARAYISIGLISTRSFRPDEIRLRGAQKTSGLCALVNMGQGKVALGRGNDAMMERLGVFAARAEIRKRAGGAVTHTLDELLNPRARRKYRAELADPRWRTLLIDIRDLKRGILQG